MEESTGFISTGRPGQVIKQALSLFSLRNDQVRSPVGF